MIIFFSVKCCRVVHKIMRSCAHALLRQLCSYQVRGALLHRRPADPVPWELLLCTYFLSWYIPCGTSVVAGDRCVLQEVQLHVVVELLRRAGIEGLRKVLHLCHEVIHVLLHGGEIQREALRGVTPVRPVCGRRCATWL